MRPFGNGPKSYLRAAESAVLVVILVLISIAAWAQGTTSRITGVVTDKTGAVVTGAKVIATNEGTNTSYTTTTKASGVYVFDSLQVGKYTVTVEASGFRKYVSQGNVLSIGLPTTVNAVLEVGSASEEVNVTGGYDLVQTDTSGNIGGTVDTATLTQLPIVGVRSRSPLSLVYLMPGVQDNGANATGGGVTVHGSRDRAWNYTLDGIDVNESTSGGSNTTPTQTNPDSISEFRVITSNATAEYGRNSGGQVTMVTKSGTNRFHGTGFWFYQSPFLQANTPQNKANIPPKDRSQFVQNIAGGSLGGPIRKDKDFFFVNVQLLHARNSFLVTRTVYTDQARQGLFRYVIGGRNRPYGSSGASVDQNGNVVPGTTIGTYNIINNDPAHIGLDPAVQKYLGMTPAPNNFAVGDGLNFAGYTFVAPQLEKQVNLTFKVDHTFSPNNAIFVRWYQGHQNTYGDSVNGGLQGFPGLPNMVDTYRKPRNLAINWRYNPSSYTTNELVLGMNRFGYEFANPNPDVNQVPPFNFNLVTAPLSSWVNNNRYATTYQLVDNFTLAHGAHTFRWGFNGRYLREIDHRGSIGSLNALPQVWFDTGTNPVSITTFNLPTDINTTYDRPNLQSAINDLLGRVGRIEQGYVANADMQSFQPPRSWNIMDHRWPEYDLYFQDSWKLKPNFTVDLGLRWEIRIAPHMANFNVLVPNQSVLFGANPSTTIKFVPGSLYNSDWNNLGPSIGFAWDPFKDGKTSIRANYRIAYDRVNPFAFSSSVFQGMPGLTFQEIDTISGPAGMRAQNWAIPAPPAGLTPQALTQLPQYGTGSLTVADPNMRTPKVYMWSFGVQREMTKNTVFSLTYIGNKGVGLFGGYDSNQVNWSSNGFLNAFTTVQAGGDSPLMDQLFSADSRKPSSQTGSDFARSQYSSYFALNNMAGLASAIATRTQGGVPLVVLDGLSPYFFKSYPQVLGGMFVLSTRDYSFYNGLEAQLERRFSDGLLFQVNWTWSKTEDLRSFDPAFTRVATGSAQSAQATPYDMFNPRLNWGPADYDRTHMFRFNWVYDLPFGRGKKFGGNVNSILNHMIGGWEIAGNGTWETGRPITFLAGSYTFSSSNYTPASCYGNCDPYLGSVQFNNNLNQQFYFQMVPLNNTTTGLDANGCRVSADGATKLCIPAPGQLSNVGRNYFRQPIYANLNATIAKRFVVHEGHDLQLRLEMQNVTNSQMYDTFGSQIITSSVFTRLNQAVDGVMNNSPRRMQLSLKYSF
jgi:hypothetical protein